MGGIIMGLITPFGFTFVGGLFVIILGLADSSPNISLTHPAFLILKIVSLSRKLTRRHGTGFMPLISGVSF